MKEEIKLTPQEKEAIKRDRELKEKTEKCAEEIQAVLDKHGMVMQIQSNPQIIIVPKQ